MVGIRTAFILALISTLGAGCQPTVSSVNSPPSMVEPANDDGVVDSTSSESPEDEVEHCTRWISGHEAQSLVEEGAFLLDVRGAEAFEDEHLEGAVNIEVTELSSRLSELPEGETVIVYCRSGRRAHQAALLLQEEGRLVKELGTMTQWESSEAGCVE